MSSNITYAFIALCNYTITSRWIGKQRGDVCAQPSHRAGALSLLLPCDQPVNNNVCSAQSKRDTETNALCLKTL